MTKTPEKEMCFVIMPISDPTGYEIGHFEKVYEDILKVAITDAGFSPIRADDVHQTNLIHLDILQKLIHSPMAVCDLSSRNPNVLFELGLRQAFDKPTVLIQEVGTLPIFDIAPMRITDYRKELKYREVIEDQKSIEKAIRATKEAIDNSKDVNSLINLLSLTEPAKLNEISDDGTKQMFQMLMAQITSLRDEFSHKLMISHESLEKEYRNKKAAWNEFKLAQSELYELERMIRAGAPYHMIKDRAKTIKTRAHFARDVGDIKMASAARHLMLEVDRILDKNAPNEEG